MNLLFKLNTELPTANFFSALYEAKPSRLDFSNARFLVPATLAPLALYLYEHPQTALVNASNAMKGHLQTYGLVKGGESVGEGVFPLHYFKCGDDVAQKLRDFLPKAYLMAYLKPLLSLLAPGAICGHYPKGGKLAFISICSSSTPVLNDFRWHLLLDEFNAVGGRLTVLQGDRFFDGKKAVEIPGWYPKTWVVFAFLITELGE
ncbi:MAG: hypothetical protein FWF59_12410 [Turicibacter sp.]|nr:hypothetical protein [Turicibacter sp.]